MADSVWAPTSDSAVPSAKLVSRHSAIVRLTHWLTAVCFLALLVSGVEILISHPRFYWGETGNVLTPPLFKIPIPSSRSTIPNGYNYKLPDQNGWSRYLHFQAAWLVVFTGLLYGSYGIFKGHFRRVLIPPRNGLSWRALSFAVSNHLRLRPTTDKHVGSYNILQQISYLIVIFVLFPLVIWTGLAMSPAFVSAFPPTVTLLGGQQSARTIHFFVSLLLFLFLILHVAMISLAGFKSRMRAMITGQP